MDPAGRITPSQTIGPFFHGGLAWAMTDEAAVRRADRWLVAGAVTDASGEGVPDALLEIWQPRPAGSPAAAGVEFQRVATDAGGRFAFAVRQAEPGPAVAHVTLFARGLLGALRTRVYVGASPSDLEALAELRRVPAARLASLIARITDPAGRVCQWPIRLQGRDETVFFEMV